LKEGANCDVGSINPWNHSRRLEHRDAGINIDNVVFTPSGSDFRELRFDLQVFDIQHLNTIVAQLRDKPVVAKVERLSG